MQERATGVILRTYPLTETSLIVHWLTRESGRLATAAKGALRPQSPFRGKLDLFYQAAIGFERSRKSELHNLREISLSDTRAWLRQDLAYLRQAAYCAALIEQTTEIETPIPEHFDLLTGLLEVLPRQPAQPLSLLAFEMKLAAESGVQPELSEARLTAGARQILAKLGRLDWDSLYRLKPSRAQLYEINDFLHTWLSRHLSRLPGGRDEALGLGGNRTAG